MKNSKLRETWLVQLCLLAGVIFCLGSSANSFAEEGPFFRLLLLPDKKAPPQEVELQIDGVPQSSRIAPGKLPAFIKLSPGQHEVSIHQPGQTVPLRHFAIQLIPGYALTAITNNVLPETYPVTFLDPLPNGRRQTTLSVYHVDMTAQPIDVLASNGGRIFSNLAPGSSARQKVNPVKVELSITRPGNTLAIAQREISLETGRSYSVFFTPDAGRTNRIVIGEDVFPLTSRP